MYVFTVLYFLIASQAGYFAIGYYRAMNSLPFAEFILVRKWTDPAVRKNLKVLYLTANVIAIMVLCIFMAQAGLIQGILFSVSTLLLLTDTIIAKTKSEKINTMISSSSLETLNSASGLKSKWLYVLAIRATCSMTGFLTLIASLIFQ